MGASVATSPEVTKVESALTYPPGCTVGNTVPAAAPTIGVDWSGYNGVTGGNPMENWYDNGVFASSDAYRPVYRFFNTQPLSFTMVQRNDNPDVWGGWVCSGNLQKTVVPKSTSTNACNVSAVDVNAQWLGVPSSHDPNCQSGSCTEQWVTIPGQVTCVYNNGQQSHLLTSAERIAFAPATAGHSDTMFSVSKFIWDAEWTDWFYTPGQNPPGLVYGFEVLKR